MNRFDRQLWDRFLAIAQPYFYPLEPGGGRAFLGLLLALLIFLFATVFVAVSAVSLGSQYLFPEFFNSIAPGLAKTVTAILYSPWIAVVAYMLSIPLCTFVYFRSRLLPRWQQWAMLALLLVLSLSVSGLNVVISYVANFFTTALAKKDQGEFWRFLFVYAGVFVVGTPIVVSYSYIRDKLGLYWRKWMTKTFLDQYFSQRNYYRVKLKNELDNPDQRIAEDIKSFTGNSLFFLLTILGAILDIISFSWILWSISKLLSVFVIFYALLGTGIAFIFVRKLMTLNFNQLKKEADFRYGLVHIRDNAESIAFYRGEAQEEFQVGQRFGQVFRNFNLLIGWQRHVGYFRKGYNYAIVILPSLLLAPIYFSGKIEYGDITQANIAFSQVLSALSVVVDQIESLSAFSASINRLGEFRDSLQEQQEIPETESRTIDTVVAPQLSLEHITLETPKHHKILVKDLSLAVQSGSGLLIVGQSGVGKSSLLRTIAGLWNSGTGHLVRPKLDQMLFLPQRPYMILGTLRSQLLYPNTSIDIDEKQLRLVLELVNLADLPERLGGFEAVLDWADVLSLGEQQRLAFARLLLTRPRYAILDEATSALDLKNEEYLYKQLQGTETTFISVGHRLSLLKYHQQVLELLGDSEWRIVPAQEYRAAGAV